MKKIQVQMSDELYQWIEEYAHNAEMSVSTAARYILRIRYHQEMEEEYEHQKTLRATAAPSH